MFGKFIGYKKYTSTYKGVETAKVAISIKEDEAGWTGDHAITITGKIEKVGDLNFDSMIGHVVAVDTNTYNGVEYIKNIVVIK